MLAAHSLTSTFPIPKEQNNRLVLPGVLLYFSSTTTIIWSMLTFVKKICNVNDDDNKISEQEDKTVVFSCHPRTLNKLEEFGITWNDNIKVCEPFGFFDFVYLQRKIHPRF
jgi:hypothetical protein